MRLHPAYAKATQGVLDWQDMEQDIEENQKALPGESLFFLPPSVQRESVWTLGLLPPLPPPLPSDSSFPLPLPLGAGLLVETPLPEF